ncbi:MAG: ABC transporter permease [Armatimonadetes bacterium]|nr:ABC transporter permease [Armatimonadota bacterium]
MSGRRMLAMARKEWIHIKRDPRSLAVALALPFALLIINGAGIDFDVTDLPFAICDLDGSQASRSLREHLVRGGLFRLVATVPNARAGERLMRDGECLFVLVIPPHMDADLSAGKRVAVQVLLDGSDANTASTARNYLTGALGAQSAQLQARAQGRLGLDVRPIHPPLTVARRFLYNPAMESRQFVVPGLIVTILVILGALLTSGTVVRERERGTFETLAASPVQAAEILLGKLVPYLVIGLIDVGIAICTGALIFRVYVAGSVELLLGCSLVFLLCALAFGLLISTVAGRQQVAMMAAIVSTLLPAIMLSGFIFPIRNMPLLLRVIAQLIPATHFLRITRPIYLKGVGLPVVWEPLLILALMACVLLALCVKRFRKQL